MSDGIKYGDRDLLEADELSSSKAKITITLSVDGDVLEAAKARAAAENRPYQALLNEVLRKHLLSSV